MNLVVLALIASLRACSAAFRRLRMLLASLCGVIAMAALVLFAGYGWALAGTALLVVPLMLLLAFGWSGGRDFGARLAISWFSIVLLNGAAEALQNMTGVRALTFYGVLLVLPAARGLVKIAQNAVRRQARMYQVRLFYREKQADCLAFYDSGNLLATAEGEPVHIVSPALMEGLGIGEDGSFVMIPYQALGTDRGWIRVVQVEHMRIGRGKDARVLSDVWLGRAEEGLFRGKHYQMILNGGKGVIP